MSRAKVILRIGGGLFLSAAMTLAQTAVAGAQDVVEGGGATPDDTVQMMKLALIGTSIVLLILTILFWIHTDPKRRAIVHDKKLARQAVFEQHSIESADSGDSATLTQPVNPLQVPKRQAALPMVAKPAPAVVERASELQQDLPIMASSMPDESDILGEVG